MGGWDEVISRINSALVAVIGVMLAWMFNRHSRDMERVEARNDELDKRLAVLEKGMVPREEIRSMHLENREMLREMTEKIEGQTEKLRARFDVFAEKSADDRHQLRDHVSTIANSMMVLAKKVRKDEGS